MQQNTLLKHCTVIDGTGAPTFAANVGFADGRVQLFRDGACPPAEHTIDAGGLTLVPGFLDAHSHGDLTLVSPLATRAKLGQGITTQIAGQCGVSLFPASAAQAGVFSRFVSGIAPYPDLPENIARLESAQGFFSWLDTLSNPLTTKCFVGHGTLRLWAMGYENRKPDAGELSRMQAMLRRCIREGALGLSTGLVYAPSCYADNEEILALLRVVHEEGAIYATHPRNEGDFVEEARAESIRLALEADVPLCVSHLKAAGRHNWGKPRAMLQQLDRAVEQGLRALVDCYPYTAGCTSLNVSIPPRYFAHGLDGLLEALGSKAERAVIREEMSRPSDYDNYALNSGGFTGVYVSSCPVDHSAEGMFVSEYAAKIGKDPYDAFFDLLLANGGLGLGIYFHMNEDDVVSILTHPLCVVGTDGLVGREGENPHPRSFGTMAHAYNLLVRNRQLLTPEAMIHKMSGQTAAFFGLANKGVLADGADADALLLDLDRFTDVATYSNGAASCEGIQSVFIGGRRIELP